MHSFKFWVVVKIGISLAAKCLDSREKQFCLQNKIFLNGQKSWGFSQNLSSIVVSRCRHNRGPRFKPDRLRVWQETVLCSVSVFVLAYWQFLTLSTGDVRADVCVLLRRGSGRRRQTPLRHWPPQWPALRVRRPWNLFRWAHHCAFFFFY